MGYNVHIVGLFRRSPLQYLMNIYHEGVEKNNDDGKQHYFSSNRHDAAAEIVCEQMRN